MDVPRSDRTRPAPGRSRRRRAVAASALVATLVVAGLAGCGADQVAGPGTTVEGGPSTDDSWRVDVDPRSFYEDYQEATAERSTGAAAPSATTTAADEGVGATELPGPPVGNLFEDPGENPWVDPAADSQSTFGLDVDTASYTVARRWIEEGSRPDPDSVRVEEYLNAVVETPTDGDGDGALRAQVAGATSPFAGSDGEVQLLRVGVQGAPLAPADRPDVDLVFVVDVSGSMDMQNRLGLVQASLALLTQELRPTDTVAVVAYGSEARTVLAPTPVSDGQAIVDAIGELVPEGSTNAEEGLEVGYDIARSNLAEGRVSRVVLASDGVANVGVDDADGLVRRLRDDADAGVRLITLGYGMGNFNDTLMEQLADRGDGFYAYVDDYDEAVRLFGEDLEASLVTVATDAKAQVTFDPAAVESYRLVGYENRDVADDDFTDDTVDAGDVGAGHSVTALYEVHLREGVDPSATIATVDLRWLDPATSAPSTASVPVPASAVTRAFADADGTTRLAALVAAWAEILGERDALAERGVGIDDLLAELDRAEPDLGQLDRFAEFADLARRSATVS